MRHVGTAAAGWLMLATAWAADGEAVSAPSRDFAGEFRGVVATGKNRSGDAVAVGLSLDPFASLVIHLADADGTDFADWRARDGRAVRVSGVVRLGEPELRCEPGPDGMRCLSVTRPLRLRRAWRVTATDAREEAERYGVTATGRVEAGALRQGGLSLPLTSEDGATLPPDGARVEVEGTFHFNPYRKDENLALNVRRWRTVDAPPAPSDDDATAAREE